MAENDSLITTGRAKPKGPTILRRVDDFIRGLANGVTFGSADYFAGTMETVVRGGDLKTNVKSEIERSQTGGIEGTVGAIAGAVLDGVGVASLAKSAAAKYGSLAVKAEAEFIGPMAGLATTGTSAVANLDSIVGNPSVGRPNNDTKTAQQPSPSRPLRGASP